MTLFCSMASRESERGRRGGHDTLEKRLKELKAFMVERKTLIEEQMRKSEQNQKRISMALEVKEPEKELAEMDQKVKEGESKIELEENL